MRFDPARRPTWIDGWWRSGSAARRATIAFVALSLALGTTSLASIYYGMTLYKSRQALTLDQFLENLVATKLSVVPNWLKGQFLARPEHLSIALKTIDYLKLAQKRQQALQKGILITGTDEYVPAFVQHGNTNVEVRMRLKGDWTDHLLGDKWSYRVKVRGQNTVFGMKQFSLHHPRARNFAYEWLFHRALAREDILGLRYDFVDVSLNGKNLGIYALEEHFEKRLIENQKRREGPIVKLNEELIWADRAATPRLVETSPTGIQSEHASFVDAFDIDGILDNPAMLKRFKLAHDLLEAFRYGELPARKVFDVERLATYFALCDLLGSTHAAIWHNLRFYYNPVTALLEPVGFDANPGHATLAPLGTLRVAEDGPQGFKDRAFGDPDFFAAYSQALERVSQPGYLQGLLDENRKDLDRILTILYKEFPYMHFSPTVLERNRASIVAALNPAKGLHAYCQGRTATALQLEVGNLQGMPLEVQSVTFRDSLVLQPSAPVILEPKVAEAPVAYQLVEFPLPSDLPASVKLARDLKISYRIVGTRARVAAVFPWSRLDEGVLSADLVRQDANVGRFPCFAVDEAQRRITLKPGTWELAESVVIPAGYEVVAGPGTQLVLGAGVTLLSHSALRFQGNAGAPIVIRSEERAPGVVVLRARGESSLEHVSFRGLANPSRNGWELTGAVTFYESPVRFKYCTFEDNHCEDALNVIRATYEIDQCLFANTKADAFDADFTTGRIVSSRFENCGNDAIDVSGSVLEVVDTVIDGAGDKGISVGENSRAVAHNLQLEHAAIALASKDRSDLRVDGVKIVDSEVAMTLYAKKAEFGPASMSVQNLDLASVVVPYLVEQNSDLVIDGAHIAANRTKVKDDLYGRRYGKASKR